jgi:phosphoadenosine phosphosulfate reductase
MSVNESLDIIRHYVDEDKQVIVDFSGGRYSLVLLHLVSKILKEINALYVDTTITLPECDDFVKDICDDWGINLKIIKRKDTDFWGMVKNWGFPGRRIRWCMKEFKSNPLRLFNESLKNDVLHIVGTSMYESSTRKRIYSVRGKYHYNFNINSFILMPLINWTEDMIYKYIEDNRLPINPCYDKYYGGGNCYYCPFISSITYYKRLLDLQPELFYKIVDAEESMRNKGAAIYKGKGKVVHLSKLLKYTTNKDNQIPFSLKDCEAKILTKKIFSCKKRCIM